jgi:dipeptidase D
VLEVGQADPGWQPDLDSPALAACGRVYEHMFGEAPIVRAVHAWLETAVIGDRVPELDMVSFGPQIEAPPSPDERIRMAYSRRGLRRSLWAPRHRCRDRLSTKGENT